MKRILSSPGGAKKAHRSPAGQSSSPSASVVRSSPATTHQARKRSQAGHAPLSPRRREAPHVYEQGRQTHTLNHLSGFFGDSQVPISNIRRTPPFTKRGSRPINSRKPIHVSSGRGSGSFRRSCLSTVPDSTRSLGSFLLLYRGFSIRYFSFRLSS